MMEAVGVRAVECVWSVVMSFGRETEFVHSVYVCLDLGRDTVLFINIETE